MTAENKRLKGGFFGLPWSRLVGEQNLDVKNIKLKEIIFLKACKMQKY